MITMNNSWSLGATPNKSLEPLGPFICSHTQGDLTAADKRPLTSDGRTAYPYDRARLSAPHTRSVRILRHPSKTHQSTKKHIELPRSAQPASHPLLPAKDNIFIVSTFNAQLCPPPFPFGRRLTPSDKHTQSTKKHIEILPFEGALLSTILRGQDNILIVSTCNDQLRPHLLALGTGVETYPQTHQWFLAVFGGIKDTLRSRSLALSPHVPR
jgi:hypothetical protein